MSDPAYDVHEPARMTECTRRSNYGSFSFSGSACSKDDDAHRAHVNSSLITEPV
jgi:hypothetical protein